MNANDLYREAILGKLRKEDNEAQQFDDKVKQATEERRIQWLNSEFSQEFLSALKEARELAVRHLSINSINNTVPAEEIKGMGRQVMTLTKVINLLTGE